MTTVSVNSHRVHEACELYIEHRQTGIDEARQAGISALQAKSRWFRGNRTWKEAEAEYKASGEWYDHEHEYYFQYQRVKLLLKVAEVAIANSNQYLELSEQNIKDIGNYIC